jgi:hypothetical protein
MSYEDRARLVSDPVFVGRLNACVANEAVAMTGAFPDRILSAWGWGGQIFSPLVVSLPGFDVPQADITDGMLLSGVQASWDRAESIAFPPETPV